MKKNWKIAVKIRPVLLFAAAVMAMGGIMVPAPVFAQTQSKGNLVMEGTEIDICTADIETLQSDMEALIGEVPEAVNVSFGSVSRKDKLRSKGTIDYGDGTVVIHSADLTYLADEIDILESSYKTNTVTALHNIGTYFNGEGSITYARDGADSSVESALRLPFSKLYEAIEKSQTVEHLAAQQAVNYAGMPLYYATEEDRNNQNICSVTTQENGFPLFIKAVSAANMTAGTAAWVDGEIVIGNGADNHDYYNQGYVDGYAAVVNAAQISYIYHQHMGSDSEGGGCYTEPLYHSHSDSCYAVVGEEPGTCPCASTSWSTGTDGYGDDFCGTCRHNTHGNTPCGMPVMLPVKDTVCGYSSGAVIGYGLGCGKSTATIESATIVFP